jgi:hypothetical protein
MNLAACGKAAGTAFLGEAYCLDELLPNDPGERKTKSAWGQTAHL